MGLLFQFPVKLDALDDRVRQIDGGVEIKSYGLPAIFWSYLAAIWGVAFFLGLAAKDPLGKMLAGGDVLNRYLAGSVWGALWLIPLGFSGFFFYEKVIVKMGRELSVRHRLFWITIWKSSRQLEHPEAFEVRHCLDSPNLAKLSGNEKMRAFANNGYFQLFVRTDKGEVLLDRHSRGRELEKLAAFLGNY